MGVWWLAKESAAIGFLCGTGRGQTVPIDFMAGLFIFMVILAYFIVVWDSYSTRYVEQAKARNDELEAIALAEQLVTSPGHPFNWTASPQTAQSIGLAQKPNELAEERVQALQQLSYPDAKRLLGLDADFLVKIESLGGARLATIGYEPSNATRAFEVTRLAFYKGEASYVKVRVYEA